MVSRCEHCGQTIMSTDSQCWHCGRRLSKKKGTPPQQPSLETAVPDDTPPALPLSTILLYVGLTAVALLILISTTRAINRAPLFRVDGSSTANVGWEPVTDSQLRFTLNLPEAWQVVDLHDADDAANFQASPPVQAVSQAWAAMVADGDLLLLGAEDMALFAHNAPTFVLIARSKRLQQLAPREIILLAQTQMSGNITIVEANVSEELSGEVKANLLLEIEQADKSWKCREQFVPGSGGIYLIATCTTLDQFTNDSADFKTILRSFQPLRS